MVGRNCSCGKGKRKRNYLLKQRRENQSCSPKNRSSCGIIEHAVSGPLYRRPRVRARRDDDHELPPFAPLEASATSQANGWHQGVRGLRVQVGVLQQFNFMFDAKEKTTPAKFPHGKIHYYVKKLTEKLRGLWHHVYMDNYFVTVFTLKTLLAKGVYCTGTCRGGKNSDTRTGFPGAILKPRNARPRKEYEEMVADPSLYACQWQDTGTVQFLSNCHCMGNVGNLKRWINGTREEFEAPAVACDYNTNMAAVDRSDALRSTLTTHRKSVKWYLAIWHWTIDLSLINAYVLYKDEYETLHGNRPGRMDRKTFHTLIAEHYMGGKPKSTSLGSSSRKRSLDASRQDAASSGIVANHQPEVVQAWRPSVKTGGKPGKHEYCVRCVALLPKNSGKRATRTSIRCDTCNKPLCIDCFKPCMAQWLKCENRGWIA